MGFVEDKTAQVDEEEVFEGGDHVAGAWRDEAAGTLGVSPAAAPKKSSKTNPPKKKIAMIKKNPMMPRSR